MHAAAGVLQRRPGCERRRAGSRVVSGRRRKEKGHREGQPVQRKELEELPANGRRPGAVVGQGVRLLMQDAARPAPQGSSVVQQKCNQNRLRRELCNPVPRSVLHARREGVRGRLDHRLVRHVLRQHVDDSDDVHHRHGALQVPRASHRVPVAVLLPRLDRLLVPRVPRTRGGRLRWPHHQVLIIGAELVHADLLGRLFLRHGIVDLVGHSVVHMVSGRRPQMGQRVHRKAFAVLPLGRLAHSHRANGCRCPDQRRRRGPSGRHLLRRQSEHGEFENVRARSTSRVSGDRNHFSDGRICVAVPHPVGDQATGRHRRRCQSR